MSQTATVTVMNEGVTHPLTAFQDGWRRPLLSSLPVVLLAFVTGMVFDPLSGQSTPFDRVAYPLMASGMLVMGAVLFLQRQLTGAVMTAVVLGSSVFFLGKLGYLLFMLPPELAPTIHAQMTETLFWVPAVYLLTLLLGNLRTARALCTGLLTGIAVLTVVYVARGIHGAHGYGVLFALLELNLANLTLHALSVIFVGYRQQLTSEQTRADLLTHLAQTDLLTGLPNRRRLDAVLAEATHGAAPFSLLLIDVDGFKLINDTLGHNTGDEVLRELAQRLNAGVAQTGTVARISGDEFVVMLPGTPPPQAMTLASALHSALSRPYAVGGQAVHLTVSVGVSAYPQDAADAETVLRHADAAMDKVKVGGKNGVRRFDAALDAELERKKVLERELQFAIDRQELRLAYQPIYDLRTGRMVKVEALLRWTHPDFGPVSPADFIPIAEACGLIIPLGAWVLRRACAEARAWQAMSPEPVVVCVNVSPLQFAQHTFLNDVRAALHDAALPAHALELELTEGAVMHSPDAVRRALGHLQQLGVKVAIDDFGTGYSSLSYLRNLPINSIKIDRSFTDDLITPDSAPRYAEALVGAIVGIARTLNLKVVAEGIESAAQVQAVSDLGCDYGQGYHLARPAAGEDIRIMLRHAAQTRIATQILAMN